MARAPERWQQERSAQEASDAAMDAATRAIDDRAKAGAKTQLAEAVDKLAKTTSPKTGDRSPR